MLRMAVLFMLNVPKLKELMKEVGIKSIKDLSREVKIPYTTIYYMINGHDMQLSTMVELAKYFGVPVDYLINKSYKFVTYTENYSGVIEASSLIEATVLGMM